MRVRLVTAARPVPALTEAQRRELHRLTMPVWAGYPGLTAHPQVCVDQRSCIALERRGLAEMVVQRRTRRDGKAGDLVECWQITPAGRAALDGTEDGR